jgi:PKD repeat protein
MKIPLVKGRRPLAILTALGLIVGGLALSQPLAASADTILPGPAPVEQRSASTVTADPLPTVQIDSGVVWSQVIVGNTVYAGGSFSNARPAGAAAGTSLMPRSNLLAYDINTGVATSFAPTVNGQIKTVAASPDGSTLYVGGTFSQVNGLVRHNVAAFSTATGALLNTWQPAVGGTYVNSIVATSSAVYVGGLLGAGNGVTRKNLMAFTPSNGALLAWAPTTDLQIDAMVMAPGKDKLIIGGRFGQVNGVSQRGLAALDLTSGAMLPWLAPQTVVNGMSDGQYKGKAGIFGLAADANAVYGTGWVLANVATGNLEGTFAASSGSGAIQWIADCHGDHYGVYSDGTNVYTASHQHACESMGGAPQSDPSTTNLRHTTAYTAVAKGTLTRSPEVSDIYADWSGYPAPAAIDWYPDWVTGTGSGQGQAAWSITGNGTYIVVGGEFPYVNGKTQQGLVRFSNKPAGGAKNGPRWSGSNWIPSVKSNAAGTARISIPANWDRDDLTLTYKLFRNGTSAALQTTTSQSTFWNRPNLVFTDTGQAAGSTQTYRLTATDPDGNTVNSNSVSVVISSAQASAYSTAVLSDGASTYWRLGTPSGGTEADWAGSNDGTIGSSVTAASSGAIAGDPSAASVLDGTSNGAVYTPQQVAVGSEYSMEFWLKTTTNSGGKLLGYGSNATGDSSSYDRHVYMTNDGRLVYGNYNNGTYTIETSKAYNDGTWHHVVATQGANGMTMYVDGSLVGTNSDTVAQGYTGYWRVGGDNMNGWPDQPSSEYFNGQMDEVAIYPTALTADQASTHYQLAQGLTAPTAQFTATSQALVASFDATGSTAPGSQTVTSYSWDFGDNTALGSGSTPTHTYAAAGTYTVALTVKSTSGLSNTVSKAVTVTAPHAKPIAKFTSTTSGLSTTFDSSTSLTSDAATITGYQWDFGDGTTSTVASPSHLYASAGTFTVTLKVTDSTNAVSDATANTVTVTHAAPAGAFAQSVSGLKVLVDGSTTTVADGATLTYDWNWGDGSAHGTGVTATHTYATAGTYQVTLGVTDSVGSSSPTVTQPVTVTHAAPVAAFTTSATFLALSANAAGSTGSDGATLTYDWNWGDGSAHGTGKTAAHNYTAAGTFTVTLTVTDSLGLTATSTSQVSVSTVTYIANDDFTRTVASGWGTANTGGAWSSTGGQSVSGGVGKLSGTTSATRLTYLTGVNVQDADTRVVFSNDKIANGGGTHFNLAVRKTAAGEYRLKVRISAAGVVTVNVAKLVGTTETLFVGKTLAGYTYVPGDALALRFVLTTTGASTQLQGKVWLASTPEPTDWTTTVTDGQAELQTAGQVGVSTYVTGSVTNGPVVTSVDAFTAQ